MHLTRAQLHAAATAAHRSQGHRHVAILGGGISGLASAHFLLRHLAQCNTPPTNYTLSILDKAPRLGGWIQSDVDAATGALLEAGPRTLRPKGLPGALTLAMVHDLGLADQVVLVPTTDPSANNRHLLFHDRIERLPSSLLEVLRASRNPASPMAGIVPLALRELFVPAARRGAQDDESIAAFLSRRFHPKLVESLVSGIVHGIYAGNPHQLSVRATFPSLWHAEQAHGSVVRGVVKGALAATSPEDAVALTSLVASRGAPFAELWARASKASIYSVRGGLEAIVRALAQSLQGKVDVRLATVPVALDFASDPKAPVAIHCADGSTVHADHVISTLPTPALHALVSAAASPPACPDLAHLASAVTPSAVTVALTNVVFRTRDLPRAVLDRTQGFGVLSPLAKGPRTDPHLLGIIYDSAAVPGLAEPELTKFTVMLGGHYLTGQEPPQPEQAGERALAAVRRHLSIPAWVAEPVVVRALVHRACIPQYGVGHVEAVARARAEMRGKRVELVGAWYDGVGVNDCVKSAWVAAKRVVPVEKAS